MVVYLLTYLTFFKKSTRELYSTRVGGGNATRIGCQSPLHLIKQGLLSKRSQKSRDVAPLGLNPLCCVDNCSKYDLLGIEVLKDFCEI